MEKVLDDAGALPAGWNVRDLPYRDPPAGVLMCAPTFFQVVDVKNPHMAGRQGGVDPEAAGREWRALRSTFAEHGAVVREIDPLPHCEDMVFCANQTFVGPSGDGSRLCVLSNMKHASRRREVPAFEEWFTAHGYRVARLPETIGFEGGGDAIWHPGRALIWGGYGHRSDPGAYEHLERLFDAPVLRLRLISDRFYHLDTCFCAIDDRTALVHAEAFEPRGMDLLRRTFERVIEVDPGEANHGFACNACALPGGTVIVQRGNVATVEALLEAGANVVEVDTNEFIKSGGSVYCMKSFIW